MTLLLSIPKNLNAVPLKMNVIFLENKNRIEIEEMR